MSVRLDVAGTSTDREIPNRWPALSADRLCPRPDCHPLRGRFTQTVTHADTCLPRLRIRFENLETGLDLYLLLLALHSHAIRAGGRARAPSVVQDRYLQERKRPRSPRPTRTTHILIPQIVVGGIVWLSA